MSLLLGSMQLVRTPAAALLLALLAAIPHVGAIAAPLATPLRIGSLGLQSAPRQILVSTYVRAEHAFDRQAATNSHDVTTLLAVVKAHALTTLHAGRDGRRTVNGFLDEGSTVEKLSARS